MCESIWGVRNKNQTENLLFTIYKDSKTIRTSNSAFSTSISVVFESEECLRDWMKFDNSEMLNFVCSILFSSSVFLLCCSIYQK